MSDVKLGPPATPLDIAMRVTGLAFEMREAGFEVDAIREIELILRQAIRLMDVSDLDRYLSARTEVWKKQMAELAEGDDA